MLVIPELSVITGWVIAQVNIFVELFGGILVLPIWAIYKGCISEVYEFLAITGAKKWVIYYHATFFLNAGWVVGPRLFHQSCGRIETDPT